jgi:site-specific recombinase XerD
MITFGTLIISFFSNYLANQKGYSPETIASYSDCIRILINYACERLNLNIDKLAIDMISDQIILEFLDHLEQERNNSPKTRNQRLAAIKTFFRFAASQEPTLIAVCERVCNISKKKTPHKLIQPLENHEVKAILNEPDINKLNGLRDKAMLTLLYNTGARVKELIDLNIVDLTMENPKQVILTGKGKKQRIIPLYQETVEAINAYLDFRNNAGLQNEALFLNAKGERITRFGIAYLIRKYTTNVASKCTSLKKKNVTPHTFRHTTALHLIQSGVDITVVKDWLGHESIKTTSLYLEINIEMKRKALQACPPPFPLSDKAENKPKWQTAPVLAFLQQLSRKAALC